MKLYHVLFAEAATIALHLQYFTTSNEETLQTSWNMCLTPGNILGKSWRHFHDHSRFTNWNRSTEKYTQIAHLHRPNCMGSILENIKSIQFANTSVISAQIQFKISALSQLTALGSSWYVPDKYKTKMVRNPTWKMLKSEQTNWRWRTDKLEVGLNQVQLSTELTCARSAKAKVCLDIPLSSKKYASMGLRCILKVLGASEDKLYALEGFVPPTHYAVWVGESD